MQQALRDACREDILYWINTFVWTYDPRVTADGLSPKLPFVTWPYQDNGFLVLDESLGKHDILIEKSRDMGASWMCLTVFMYRWLFFPMESYLMVSRKESLVDGDGDSLFAHLDFIMKGMPSWMLPKYRRMKLKLFNEESGAMIEGESNTSNIGRGGRRGAMLIDEYAAFDQGGWEVLSATADNTRCRIFNSTPFGVANAFYSQREKGTPRLRFHWSEHPGKGEGQYVDADGKTRSPWYDNECQRRASAVEIATQLDIDYHGSAYPFFDHDTLKILAKDFCREPRHVGTLYMGPGQEPEFTEDNQGPLRVWCNLDERGRPPSDRDYVVAVDVSQGTGASDSAICVGDRLSGEKVAEFCSNEIAVHHFAELAVTLCRMFEGPGGRGAYLIWEATGPGRTFGSTVVDDCRYSNIYYFEDDRRVNRKASDRPGWFSTGDGKNNLLHGYRNALFSKQFLNPSQRSLDQAAEFIYLANGKIEHGGASNTINPSDRNSNHGDLVIADALCCKILSTRKQKSQREESGPDPTSMAFRRLERESDATLDVGW